MTEAERIIQLKREKNAVVLAHYYVPGEVQEIADYVGDSFYLSQAAVSLECEQIIFAGVRFMGESAKLLNPGKHVHMPEAAADCPMAHMIDAAEIERVRSEHPEAAVVCYINSTTEVKACADVCVTSSNAVNIVKKLPNKEIYFIPDKNLGRYVAKQVPEKTFIFNDGCCPRHQQITAVEVIRAKEIHPGALFLAHPECTASVLALADYIGSTSGIITYAEKSSQKKFIIGTMTGVFHELKKRNPDKTFYAVNNWQYCDDMLGVTLEKVRHVLETDANEVFVDEGLSRKARAPLIRMLKMAD